jgi:hypothetical protein
MELTTEQNLNNRNRYFVCYLELVLAVAFTNYIETKYEILY